MIGQAYHESAQDSKYVPAFRDRDEDKGSRFNQDRQAFNKLSFQGRGGNLSSRPMSGRNANTPLLGNAARFQRSRSKNRK